MPERTAMLWRCAGWTELKLSFRIFLIDQLFLHKLPRNQHFIPLPLLSNSKGCYEFRDYFPLFFTTCYHFPLLLQRMIIYLAVEILTDRCDFQTLGNIICTLSLTLKQKFQLWNCQQIQSALLLPVFESHTELASTFITSFTEKNESTVLSKNV